MLEPNYFGINCNKNLKFIDIYTQNGEIMSKVNVDMAIGVNVKILKYNTLKTIIPTHWRKSQKLKKRWKRYKKKLTPPTKDQYAMETS